MSKDYFTSDLHFYHKNIMKFCPETRPYESVDEMNEALFKAWNETVGPDDRVFFLGDLCFRKGAIEDVLKRLNGRIYFILGNHDFDNRKDVQDILKEHCEWVGHYYHYKHQKVSYYLMHFPMMVWNKAHHGSVHLHGHCHGDVPYTPGEHRIMDVGWDAVGGRILPIEEIHSRMMAIDNKVKHHQ